MQNSKRSPRHNRRKLSSKSPARLIEALEDRRLLSAFATDINFAPLAAPVPSGYVADNGLIYGNRGSGMTYGWNGPHKAQVVARHPKKTEADMGSPDYDGDEDDTFAVMHARGTGSQWTIAVPDGNYTVSITVGDPSQNTGRYALDVNGAAFLSGKVSRGAGRWLTGTMTVTVTTGYLTLTVPKEYTAKLDDIAISQIIPTPPTPPTYAANANIPASQFDSGSTGITTESGGSTGTVVDNTTVGQWLDYTLDVATAGSYILTANVANDTAGGSFHGDIDGTNVTGSMAVPDTGGLTTYALASSGSFTLSAGTHTLQVYIDATASTGTAGNFDYFNVTSYYPQTPAETPYNSSPFSASEIIPAAQYDEGGQGVAFEVSTTSNPGNDTYRSGDPVDINTGGATGNVVTMQTGSEWLNYTVDIATTGDYVLTASASNTAAGGAFHAEVGNANVTGSISVPDTGSVSTFQDVTSSAFNLSAGSQVLHVVFDAAASGGVVGNFDKFELLPYTAPKTPTNVEAPFNSTPFTVGETIPAAQYDLGGAGLGYNTTATSNLGNDNYRAPDPVGMTAGGTTGNVIGYTTTGEWLDYTVAIVTTGSYTLSASVANAAAGGTFYIQVDGVTATSSVSIPNVGNFTAFQTVTSSAFTMSAGIHVLRVVMSGEATNGAVGNFDTLSLAATPTTTTLAPLSWTTLAQPGVPTIEGGSISVNGKLYVMGGFYTTGNGEDGQPNDGTWRGTSTCQVYDPTTNKWSYIAPIPDIETHEECATDGTYIYMAGGNLYNPVNTYQTFATTETWRYDIATDTWSSYVPLPAPRGAGSLVLVGNELHFMGGVDVSRVPQTTHWKLDITSTDPQWVLDTPEPSPRNHVATFSYNGMIYLMGGRDLGTDTGLPLASCYAFNPTTDAWSQIASMPKPLAVTCYSIVDGLLVIMGGSNDASTPIDTVIAYDPTTNTWSYLNSFNTPKIGPNGGFVDNDLIVSGGAGLSGGPEGSTYGAIVTQQT